MIDLRVTLSTGNAEHLFTDIATNLDRNVHELIDQILQDGAERMRLATPRGQTNPEQANQVHAQDAYAVHWDGELHGSLVNTAPQFFALWDVPEQDIHGHPVLRFWDGGTLVFARSVHFPGPNQDVVAAWDGLPDAARTTLAAEGAGVVVKGRP